MTWLSGAVDSFAEAEQVFLRIGRMSISDSSIWRRKEGIFSITWGNNSPGVEKLVLVNRE
jgi:hypothetical protein